jgi:hypothetical protein
MIATLVRGHSPSELAATMDADWRPAFRVAAIPTYKAHRVAHGDTEEVPGALVPQIPVIEQVLDAIGVARLESPGYEADDVIGTLTHQASGAVDIVTGDRDLFQLVDDARPVRVLYTVRGLRNLQLVDEAFVAAKYGIPGRAYADFATLRGDPSDGLPGVAGVGRGRHGGFPGGQPHQAGGLPRLPGSRARGGEGGSRRAPAGRRPDAAGQTARSGGAGAPGGPLRPGRPAQPPAGGPAAIGVHLRL